MCPTALAPLGARQYPWEPTDELLESQPLLAHLEPLLAHICHLLQICRETLKCDIFLVLDSRNLVRTQLDRAEHICIFMLGADAAFYWCLIDKVPA